MVYGLIKWSLLAASVVLPTFLIVSKFFCFVCLVIVKRAIVQWLFPVDCAAENAERLMQ
jgi:hypothetical protein